MFFQLIAESASLTIPAREGRSYTFEKGKPVKVDRRDIEIFKGRSDVEECSEEGCESRKMKRPEPSSQVTFSGPSSEPSPKPAPHEPTPKELAEAKGRLKGSA